ncbi:MAG: hypothetical protein JXB23_06745 [Candidatus Aminicenantes bacterium]|nr:hypothetical protein [Candidatus Aminicenantes bacterium]
MSEKKTREIRISIPEDLFALFIPEETVGHLKKARKEMLLSLRSLIDARIEALEKSEKIKTTQKKKIKIE